ncbi:MAG: hypothetical protein Kapaf2KO_10040 [Candidatus Kapaibacteriales bacterium]
MKGIADDSILKYYQDDYIDTILSLLQEFPLYQQEEIEDETVADGISMRLYPSGHVMGAASVLLNIDGRRVLHTGDIRFDKQFFVAGAKPPVTHIDTIITESTNGAQKNAEPLDQTRKRLAKAINKAVSANGSVLLPAFSTGKTQEITTLIWSMMRRGQIPHMPIFTNGISIPISKVYDRYCYSDWAHRQGFELRDIPKNKVRGREAKINDLTREPSISIVTNGMMKEGSLSYNIALEYMKSRKHLIGFVGYQDDREPGYALLNAQKGEKIQFGTRTVKPQCQIGDFRISSHAEPDILVDYIAECNPQKVFLVHGDMESVESLGAMISDRLKRKTKIVIPQKAREYDLFT